MTQRARFVTLLVGVDGEHGILERQQATQAQAQHRKRHGGDGGGQLNTGPQNARDHFSAVDRGGSHVIYFALQHHVVELMAQVCQRHNRGDRVMPRGTWGRTVDRLGQPLAGGLQQRRDPGLGFDGHAPEEIVRYAVDFFQPVVEQLRLTQTDAIGCVRRVQQSRVVRVAEHVVADDPFAVNHQAMDLVGVAGRDRRLVKAVDGALQPGQVDPGDVAAQAALQRRVFHLQLVDRQRGVAPLGVAGAGRALQLGAHLVDVALADPYTGHRACDVQRGQAAQVDASRPAEGGRGGKFRVDEADIILVAVPVKPGIGQGRGHAAQQRPRCRNVHRVRVNIILATPQQRVQAELGVLVHKRVEGHQVRF